MTQLDFVNKVYMDEIALISQYKQLSIDEIIDLPLQTLHELYPDCVANLAVHRMLDGLPFPVTEEVRQVAVTLHAHHMKSDSPEQALAVFTEAGLTFNQDRTMSPLYNNYARIQLPELDNFIVSALRYKMNTHDLKWFIEDLILEIFGRHITSIYYKFDASQLSALQHIFCMLFVESFDGERPAYEQTPEYKAHQRAVKNFTSTLRNQLYSL